MSAKSLFLGLLVALVAGGVVVSAALWAMRKSMGVSKDTEAEVPGWLTGSIERAVFTVLFAYGASGIATAMIGWLALKFVTNWNHPRWHSGEKNIRGLAFSALLAGLISMLFAAIGGRIASGQPIW